MYRQRRIELFYSEGDLKVSEIALKVTKMDEDWKLLKDKLDVKKKSSSIRLKEVIKESSKAPETPRRDNSKCRLLFPKQAFYNHKASKCSDLVEKCQKFHHELTKAMGSLSPQKKRNCTVKMDPVNFESLARLYTAR